MMQDFWAYELVALQVVYRMAGHVSVVRCGTCAAAADEIFSM